VRAGGVEIVNACGSLAWQALGAQAGGMDIVQACACMGGGTAQQNGDCACVDPQLRKPEGHGLADIVNVCGSLAW
jgi:hypothetical protein